MVLCVHPTAVLAKTPHLPGNPVLVHFYGAFHLPSFNSNALFLAALAGMLVATVVGAQKKGIASVCLTAVDTEAVVQEIGVLGPKSRVARCVAEGFNCASG